MRYLLAASLSATTATAVLALIAITTLPESGFAFDGNNVDSHVAVNNTAACEISNSFVGESTEGC